MKAKVLAGPGNARGNIQSVDRALLLLETIAAMGGEASLSSLAKRTGLNISTCHHLLATLIQRGFVAKVTGERLYTLGGRVLHLSHAAQQVDLPRLAQPLIERIGRVTGEMVHLAALQGENVEMLTTRDVGNVAPTDAWPLCKSDSAHATAVGKAMLAWLPEQEMRRIVGDQMKRFTEHTIVDFPALCEELRLVRRQGFAVDREEYLHDIVGIAAAIRDHAGAVIGAIGATAPSARATGDRLAVMRDEVLSAARELSSEFPSGPVVGIRGIARTAGASA